MNAWGRVLLHVVTALSLGTSVTFAGGDAEQGKLAFDKLCAGCHGADGRGGAHTFMPHVDTLTKRDYIEQVPDEYLALVIMEGGIAVGKSSYMPSWKSKLEDADVQHLIAFIRSLPSY